MIKTYIKQVLIIFAIACFSSCEVDKLESNLGTAPGGGTLTSFVAYTIESTDPTGSNVYGRIVFWETSLGQTLAQVSLYNTVEGLEHPALIIDGDIDGAGTTTMLDLGSVSGNTGELMDSKFYVISDTAFYDSILTMDAHITIYLSPTDNTIVAQGDLGANATPVDSN